MPLPDPQRRHDGAHRCLNCGDTMPYAPADRLLCSGCDDVAQGRVPLSIRMSSDRGRAAEIVAAGAVIRAKVEGHREAVAARLAEAQAAQVAA